MLIVLNKHANNGKGFRKWKKSRPELEGKCLGHNYRLISDWNGLRQRLNREVTRGEKVFVAAGGDGTINFLLNQIMDFNEEERRQLVLGAIGLGSSNDFHKPFSKEKCVNGHVRFKLDYEHALQHNVGQVDFEDAEGKWQRKYFIINCSVGVIAQANYLFNSDEKAVKWLKSRWVLGTIWYVALKTIFSAQNIPAQLQIREKNVKTEVTTLSIVINPHFSGNLCYDFDVSPQSPFFAIALCERMSIRERLKTIYSLARSKFRGLPKTRSWEAQSMEISPAFPTPLELDGEVYLARKINIRLLKGALKVCQ
jgi:diacylglycerol kinase (ATP)